MKALEAFRARGSYFRDLVLDKRSNPGDDMIGQLIEAEVTADDGTTQRLTDDEIVQFATLLALGGLGDGDQARWQCDRVVLPKPG